MCKTYHRLNSATATATTTATTIATTTTITTTFVFVYPVYFPKITPGQAGLPEGLPRKLSGLLMRDFFYIIRRRKLLLKSSRFGGEYERSRSYLTVSGIMDEPIKKSPLLDASSRSSEIPTTI